MAKPLKLRVFCVTKDGHAVDIDAVVQWIRTESPTHFVVRHEADKDDARPHIHAIMWSMRDPQSLRDAIKKAVPSVTRQYSIGAVTDKFGDVAAYERYMCHGSHEGDVVNVISSQAGVDGVHKYTKKWCAEQNSLFYSTRKEWVAEKKQKERPLIDKVHEECKAAGVTRLSDIGEVVLKIYDDENRPFNTYHQKALLRAAWYRVNKEKAKASLLDELMRGLEI